MGIVWNFFSKLSQAKALELRKYLIEKCWIHKQHCWKCCSYKLVLVCLLKSLRFYLRRTSSDLWEFSLLSSVRIVRHAIFGISRPPPCHTFCMKNFFISIDCYKSLTPPPLKRDIFFKRCLVTFDVLCFLFETFNISKFKFKGSTFRAFWLNMFMPISHLQNSTLWLFTLS